MNIRFSKTKNVRSPERGTPESAGIDFFVPHPEDAENSRDEFKSIAPYQGVMIPSGIRVQLPKGKALLFVNRSGLASKKGIVVGACLVDSDYQGEIFFNLRNISNTPAILRSGDKCIQGLIIDVPEVTFEQVQDEDLFEEPSIRGTGGFGSTDYPKPGAPNFMSNHPNRNKRPYIYVDGYYLIKQPLGSDVQARAMVIEPDGAIFRRMDAGNALVKLSWDQISKRVTEI